MRTPETCKAFVIALFLSSLFLVSCGDDERRSSVRASVYTMTVGISIRDTVTAGFFNAYEVPVVPGALYKISMTSPTDDADLFYSGSDNTYSTTAGCLVDNTAFEGLSPEDCIVIAPGALLYFGVDGGFLSTPSAAFTIKVELLEITDISTSVPILDSTDPAGARIYAASVQAGSDYVAAITGLNNDVDLHVFSGNTLEPVRCLVDNTQFSGSTPEDCTLRAPGGIIYFIADGIFSTSPEVLYTAFIAPAPVSGGFVNEGSPAAPFTLSLDTPASGQVGFSGSSYYAVSGLTAGRRYTVSLNGLTNSADLVVYNNNTTFTAPAVCAINNTAYTGTTAEACTLTAAGSTVYFKVAANTSGGGAGFVLLVEPGP